MPQTPNDLSRSLTALEQTTTLVAVVEMSQASWLVAGMIPGLERQPLKKIAPNEAALLSLLQRWQEEAIKICQTIRRITVASYEAPAVKRELPRDRSKAELRVIGTGIARPSSYPVGSTDPNHDPGHPGGAAPRWRHHSE